MLSEQSPRARNTLLRAAAATAAVTLGIILSGCGGPKSPSPSPSTPVGQSSAHTPEQDAADKALAAYSGFLTAYATAGETANYESPELKNYLADPLLGDVVSDLYTKSKNGYITKGKPTFEVLRTDVHLNGQPTNVQLAVCFDDSKWDVVKKATGESVVAAGQPHRYKVTTEVVQYDDGRWLVRKGPADRSATC